MESSGLNCMGGRLEVGDAGSPEGNPISRFYHATRDETLGFRLRMFPLLSVTVSLAQ